jgi:TonB family protein
MRGCALFLCLVGAGLVGAADAESHKGLGLLAGRVQDAAARGRLQAALADPDPVVRAAAVRVINVSGVGDLVPALVTALGKEQEAAPAAEMIRFLASLNRPELDAAALEAAKRLGRPTHLALVDGLGRRGGNAADHIPTLRSLGLADPAWSVFFGLASQDSSGLTRLANAILRDGDAGRWSGLLASSRRTGYPLEESVTSGAVQNASPEIRRATYWHLAILFDPKRPPGDSLGAALDASVEAGKEPPDPGAALAFEVLQRLRGRPHRPLLETLDSLGPAVRKQLTWDAVRVGRIGGVLDKEERKAVAAGLFGKKQEEALDDWPSKPGLPAPREPGPYQVVQTIGEFPPGYVSDVLESSGCDMGKVQGLMGGEISYGADGRPRHAGVLSNRASKECNEAARALLVSTLAPLGVPTKEQQKSLLLVPRRSEFLKCIDWTARTPSDESSRVGSQADEDSGQRIQEPRKTHNVPPEYPSVSKAQRRGGVVILEATISPTGCVSGISLIAGVDTALDLAAFDAVSGWAYTPTLLRGTPVPVIMTVTVNFRIN